MKRRAFHAGGVADRRDHPAGHRPRRARRTSRRGRCRARPPARDGDRAGHRPIRRHRGAHHRGALGGDAGDRRETARGGAGIAGVRRTEQRVVVLVTRHGGDRPASRGRRAGGGHGHRRAGGRRGCSGGCAGRSGRSRRRCRRPGGPAAVRDGVPRHARAAGRHPCRARDRPRRTAAARRDDRWRAALRGALDGRVRRRHPGRSAPSHPPRCA